MGASMRSTVRKAARLAVYELIMMRVKNHQKLATVRVDTARGKKSQPWTDTPEVLTLGLFNKTFKETLSQIFGLHFFPQKKLPLAP
jgi:hypothetical protein